MSTRDEFLTQAALATFLADANAAPAISAEARINPAASGAAP
jgi:hypothetical protein